MSNITDLPLCTMQEPLQRRPYKSVLSIDDGDSKLRFVVKFTYFVTDDRSSLFNNAVTCRRANLDSVSGIVPIIIAVRERHGICFLSHPHVCSTITFESIDLESSCLVYPYIFRMVGTNSFMKVIGSR